MNMIKKIAVTASILLFVLAQFFSFYIIGVSHREKIELHGEKERKIFLNALADFSRELNKIRTDVALDDSVITYCFRKSMPEGTALYNGEKELFNGASYEFDVKNVDWENEEFLCGVGMKQEKIGGRYLLVFYEKENSIGKKDDVFYLFYLCDITSVYTQSVSLAARELFVTSLASVGMAFLLVYLIKKITRPLQEANEAQRQLIGSMSHELKTPLTAIKGYSETLLSVNLSNEQQQKALLYINRESGRLSRLSEKMMELTKLYAPDCNIRLQEIPLEELFSEVEKSVNHRLSEKNMTLTFEGDYKGRNKKLDEDLMVSFLINLINNSVDASKDGGRIFIGADEHSIWVRDEGCGIARQEVEKVKKAFYRVDASRSGSGGNMGLGLALCEQIALAHGGAMEIESEPKKGTKVFFTDRLRKDEYF